MIDKSKYHSEYRNELLPYVPVGIRKTLDVGCGEGVFSAGLKAQYNIEAWGVEMVEDAANGAASKLDNVFTGVFEDVYGKLPANYFDCIFFNDVLEHMIDPYSVLAKAKKLLIEGGVIICSIPNVRYFPNLYELLVKKDWKYKDAGILDRTHLRFFTKKSINRMFEELGFEVMTIEGVNQIASWKGRLTYYLANIVFLGAFRDSYCLQYACVVKPKPLG